MGVSFKGVVSGAVGWAWRDLSGALPVTDSGRLEMKSTMADGAGAGECNAVWHRAGQALQMNDTVEYRLDQLQLEVFCGQIEVPMANVKALMIVNRNESDTGYLLVGGSPSQEWHDPFGAYGDRVKVMAGSPLLLANVIAGWDVTVLRNRLLLQAVGGAVTYDIAILGSLDDTGSSSSSG